MELLDALKKAQTAFYENNETHGVFFHDGEWIVNKGGNFPKDLEIGDDYFFVTGDDWGIAIPYMYNKYTRGF